MATNFSDQLMVIGGTMDWKRHTGGAFVGEYIPFGNLATFTSTVTKEKLDDFGTACDNLGQKTKSQTIRTEITGAMVLKNVSPDTIALAFNGVVNHGTPVIAGTDATQTIASALLNKEEQLDAENITAIKVMDTLDTIEYTVGVDYKVNYKTGVLTVISDDNITDGDALNVTYSNNAYTPWSIAAYSQDDAEGKFRFTACSLEGQEYTVFFEKLSITLDGDFSFMSTDAFLTIPLKFDVLVDENIIKTPTKSNTINFYGSDVTA